MIPRRNPRSAKPGTAAGRNPRLSIRPLTRGRAGEFLSLVDALADYEKLDRPDAAAKRRLVRDCTGRKPRFECLLAFSGPTAAGYAVFFETYSTFLARPTLYLEDLFVLPERRGEGIGLRLFRACVAAARRRGCGRMDWTVLDWNTSAAGFYGKLGATHLREWHLYRLPRSGFARAMGGAKRGRHAPSAARQPRRPL
jgi:GNAT superfamily N-acetyltransferase